jgi:hypothetical protein
VGTGQPDGERPRARANDVVLGGGASGILCYPLGSTQNKSSKSLALGRALALKHHVTKLCIASAGGGASKVNLTDQGDFHVASNDGGNGESSIARV